MPSHQLLRVDFERDVTAQIVTILRDVAARAELFAEAPLVYVAGHERRARDIRVKVGAAFPEGTPERVARELLKLYAPDVELHGGVERDFDFFACLHEALAELKSTRPATRALVDEALGAWRRMADALPPAERTPQALSRWLAPLGERGRLLSALLMRYHALLGARRDADDVLWVAAELMPRMKQGGLAPELVLIDELDAVSAAREAFLRALLGSAKRGLCVLRGSGETLPYLRPALQTLQGVITNDFEGNAYPQVEAEPLPRAGLCASWLAGEAAKLPGDVNIARPASREAEIRDTARAIKRLVKAGTALDKIAVVLPVAENYRGLLETIFGAAGIPFDAPLEVPLAQSPPVAALLELLRAARGGLERAELLDALASPLLPFDCEEAARAKWLSEVDRLSRAANVVGGENLETDWLKPMRAACGNAEDRAVVTRLERVLKLLAPLTRREIKPSTFFGALRDLAGEAQILSAVKRGLPALRAAQLAGLHELGKLVRELYEGFRRIGDSATRGADLARALLEQAQTRTLRPPVPQGAHVRVRGLKEMRGAQFEHVFVLGLTDEDLPLPQGDSMFFPRTLEERLAPLLGARAARALCQPIDAATQADYLFATVLQCGEKSLTLSLPKAQGEKPFVPAAPFARLLSSAAVDLDKLPAMTDTVPVSPGELAQQAGLALRELEYGAAGAATLALSEPLRAGLRGRAIELARSDEAAPPGRFEGLAASALLAKRFGPAAEEGLRHTFSASQFDTYADCPMRFWMRYVLRVTESEEPTRDTPPTAVGSLVHHILQAFVHLLRKALGQEPVLADPLARKAVRVLDLGKGDAAKARACACGLMLEAIEIAKAALKPHGPFWEGALLSLSAGLTGESDLGHGLLSRVIDHELERNALGFGIRFVELRIGGNSQPDASEPDVVPGALEFAVPGGVIRVQGSVDRVDEGKEGLQIIDYKTGGAKTTTEIRDGAAFQLPLYLATVSAKTGVAPYGMAYYLTPLLKPLEFKDVTLAYNKPAFDVGELVKVHLPRRLGALVAAVERGVFIHLPSRPASGSGSPCGYCEFSSACAVRAQVVAARQERAESDLAALCGAYRPDKLLGAPKEDRK